MVTASASTPMTATAINQVSHSTPSKPNNRPSRQKCANMTLLPGLQPLHQGILWEAQPLFWRPELRGHPPPNAGLHRTCLTNCELCHSPRGFNDPRPSLGPTGGTQSCDFGAGPSFAVL